MYSILLHNVFLIKTQKRFLKYCISLSRITSNMLYKSNFLSISKESKCLKSNLYGYICICLDIYVIRKRFSSTYMTNVDEFLVYLNSYLHVYWKLDLISENGYNYKAFCRFKRFMAVNYYYIFIIIHLFTQRL